MLISGPSGIVCEARRFIGEDIQAVADKLEEGKSMSDQAMCSLLSTCWQSTVDPGPYSFGDAKPNFYNQVLKRDVAALLITLRVGSFRKGADYSYKVRCADQSCREPVQWYTNLVEHVVPRVSPLSEQGLAHVQDGVPIRVEFEEGFRPTMQTKDGEVEVRDVGCQLMTLQREEQMKKFLKQEIKRRERKTKDILLADRLGSQLLDYNGGERFTTVGEKLRFARKLPQDDLYFLRDQLDLHDCEMDMIITVKCGECGWEFDTPLPFGPSFLDPTILSRREKLFGTPGEETIEAIG